MPGIVIFGIGALIVLVVTFVLYNLLYPVWQKHLLNREIKNQKRLKQQREERHRTEDANIKAREEAIARENS